MQSGLFYLSECHPAMLLHYHLAALNSAVGVCNHAHADALLRCFKLTSAHVVIAYAAYRLPVYCGIVYICCPALFNDDVVKIDNIMASARKS